MTSQLEQSFADYVSKVRQKLALIESRIADLSVQSRAVGLQETIAELETDSDFSKLVDETTTVFRGKRHGRRGWREAAGNWFRRSGLYEQLAAGGALDSASAFRSYCFAFSQEQTEETYLALLEFIYLGKDKIVFGPFEIRRMSKDDLDRGFRNSTRALFYPGTRIPSDGLSGYWWLIARERESASPIGKIVFDFGILDQIRRMYTPHRDPIELALQALVLYRWLPRWMAADDPSSRWCGFQIPFTLRTDDNLRVAPFGRIPDARGLTREPLIDPETGEEYGDEPILWFYLDEAETVVFEAFVQEQAARILRLRERQWSKDLVEVALGFLVRAFFADGVDQLLWHITTIEALFSEKGAGVTERLAQRVSRILGNTESERKEVRKHFRQLYEVRSELVHGTPIPREVQAAHLNRAREYARSVTVWFLHWIDDLLSKSRHNTRDLPNREDLLEFLDLEEDSRKGIKWLAESVSPEFPRVANWLK